MEEPDRSPSLLCVTYTADITASFPLDKSLEQSHWVIW